MTSRHCVAFLLLVGFMSIIAARTVHPQSTKVSVYVSVRVLKCINIYSLERDDMRDDGSGGNAEQ